MHALVQSVAGRWPRLRPAENAEEGIERVHAHFPWKGLFQQLVQISRLAYKADSVAVGHLHTTVSHDQRLVKVARSKRYCDLTIL